MEKLKEKEGFITYKPSKQFEELLEKVKAGDFLKFLKDFVAYAEDFYVEIAKRVNWILGTDGSATWNPGSIANGAEEAKEITVTGAVLGDFAIASFSLDVSDLTLTANVTDDNTVTCVLANNTGGAVDLAEGTLRVRVLKQ